MKSTATDKENLSSYWDYGDCKEDPIHRIHSYPAKFPAFITTKALRYAEKKGVDIKVVADVFCGCGTTGVEARRNGKDFWGCDINPVASLIAKVKTHQYRGSTLVRYFEAIMDDFQRTRATQSRYSSIPDRIHYWYQEKNIRHLIRLDDAIRRQTPEFSPYRNFFLCGFSNILKPTSLWLTKSIKAQRDLNKLPKKVMDAFEDQFALMRKANQENHYPTPLPRIRIRTQNFLTTRTESKADLIVTSPPYVSRLMTMLIFISFQPCGCAMHLIIGH